MIIFLAVFSLRSESLVWFSFPFPRLLALRGRRTGRTYRVPGIALQRPTSIYLDDPVGFALEASPASVHLTSGFLDRVRPSPLSPGVALGE